MTLANKNAGYANIISVCNKTAAAMNDDIVWQDGNEQSYGIGIKSDTARFIQQGRGRQIMFLSKQLPINTPIIRPTSMRIPDCRYFLQQINRNDIAIQTIPPSPSDENFTINESKNLQRNLF